MEKFNIGIIGMGARGKKLINKLISSSLADVTVLCDTDISKAHELAEEYFAKTGLRPAVTDDYKDVLSFGGINGVIVATSWESHIGMSIDAMKKGVPVLMEVGGAYSVYECHELVRAYEETKTPFMFFENCCFDETELWITSMVRNGLFGEVVHCSGCYAHDLRRETVLSGNYRLMNYMHRDCENYATHELGPIAKLLNINRGNRMVSLVSVASKARGLEDYVNKHREEMPKELIGKKFNQGDVITTMITCANGETIHLRLDTTLPRMYDRGFTVHGTNAFSSSRTLCLDGEERWLGITDEQFKKYKPECWASFPEKQEDRKFHEDKDGLALKCFIDCVQNGKEIPIDVYDAAAWMVVTCLSEASVKQGGIPQAIPDFTHGEWLRREPIDVVQLPKVDA